MSHTQRAFARRLSVTLTNPRAYFSFENNCEEPVKRLVERSTTALNKGIGSPTLCQTGVGGTYFLYDDQNRTIGVFKPQDEEMGSINNPKGFTPKSASFKDDSAKRGVSAGEAAFRECAAYVVDHDHFSGVPATDMVTCTHPFFHALRTESLPTATEESSDSSIKMGSFQEYKPHDFDTEDIGRSQLAQFPVHEVHKIAILDIRLFNTDRHGGNILVRRKSQSPPKNRRRSSSNASRSRGGSFSSDGGASDGATTPGFGSPMQFSMDMLEDEDRFDDYDPKEDEDDDYDDEDDEYGASQRSSKNATFELIPIDHGFCLPHTVDIESDSAWFEWLNWPQAKLPFTPEELRYIERLNAEDDIKLLQSKFGDHLRPECYKVLQVTTLWLKTAARKGFTSYDIGRRMCRRNPEAPSDLQKMCADAQRVVDAQIVLDKIGNTGAARGGRQIPSLTDKAHLLFLRELKTIMERVEPIRA